MKFRTLILLPATLLILSFQTGLLSGQEKDHLPADMIAPLPSLEDPDGESLSLTAWEEGRRAEILALFEDHVYGRVPDMDVQMQKRVTFMDRTALGGRAKMKEVEITFFHEGDSAAFTMLVFLPAGAKGPVPLFLGLNFYGNHTIHPDPSISLTQTKVPNNEALHITENRATDASRGVRADRWPVEMILERGYGLATIYCGDLDVDEDDGFHDGVHALDHGERDRSSWGTIAGWAWGLSRAMDYFERDVEVDHHRVAVIGHSRLGKTALWAGAQDQRFALVVSNNSGCGGAALNRRKVGESVERINRVFPHWFADRFKVYGDNEAALPVDQHMLMALMAPRALYVASASEDEWADPRGEYMSLHYGSRAYELYGVESMGDALPPGPEQPRWQGRVAYHIRTGKHDITAYDWARYLDFADRHLQEEAEKPAEDGVSMEWIAGEIRKESPRLVLTPEVEALLQQKLKEGDKAARSAMKLMESTADAMLELPLLEFNKQGRRLLGVSREALRRLSTLALVYRIEQNPLHLQRLEDELEAVCSFEDWNPSHFLDVGEMAAAVALALDWSGEWISPEVNGLARKALLDKALKPGLAPSPTTFFTEVHHNWNMVCNGGLALAALCVFEDEPELASRVIHQAVRTLPASLEPYAPHGIYPEGVSYWSYATTYLSLAISAFESALGTDFGFSSAPGLMESVLFSRIMAGPGGQYYNFFDAGSGGYQGITHQGLQAWFARRSGEAFWLEAYEQVLSDTWKSSTPLIKSRAFPFFFLELAQLEEFSMESPSLPRAWAGEGNEPIGIFRDPDNDPESFFLAAKGGRASDNHGNMDAGSFIFELDGIRWSVDPGNQGYHELEQIMGAGLWERGQDSPRWGLLTKSNLGHSTLTINGENHLAERRAPMEAWDFRGEKAMFTFDLGPAFGKQVEGSWRSFIRSGRRELTIRDHLLPTESTEIVTWQMMTTAAVSREGGGLKLEQDEQQLFLRCECSVPHEFRIVELDPPPLEYDKQIPDLKRIEISFREIPAEAMDILVTLSAEPL